VVVKKLGNIELEGDSTSRPFVRVIVNGDDSRVDTLFYS